MSGIRTTWQNVDQLINMRHVLFIPEQAITRWSEDQVKRMYMDLTISWTEL